MTWLFVLCIVLAGCSDCKPFIKARLDSRLDNRWEGPVIADKPLAGVKCKF